MAEIKNLQRVVAKLRDMAAKAAGDEGSVVVGYTAAHAIYVHEMRNAVNVGTGVPRKSGKGVYWGPNGRPGFLLDVAREMVSEIKVIIFTAMKKTRSLVQSLLLAGLRLQRESQQNVPVEYGALRASAFTRVEK